tara:strand:- start:9799 stop:10941 length:1143 start_codon:yes stop_codon:yes gene_type:complete
MSFDPVLSPNGDNAEFILAGRDILTGSYTSNRFPAGWPAVLALIQGLGGGLIAMKLFVVVCFVALVCVVTWFHAWQPAAAIAVCAPMLSYSTYVMAEIPFALASTLCLLVVRRKGKWWIVASVCLCLSGLFKSQALALGLALAVFYKNPKWLLPLIPSFAFRTSAYAEELLWLGSGFPERIINNLIYYFGTAFPEALIPIPNITTALGFLVLGYAVWKMKLGIQIYFGLYLGMVMIWPDGWKDTRFIVPLLPVVFIALPKQALYALMVIGGLFVPPKAVSGGIHWAHYYDAAIWAKTNTPDSAVVAARKPHNVEVLSERESFRWSLTGPMDLSRADYVLLDPIFTSSINRVYPYLVENKWVPVFATPQPAQCIVFKRPNL